MISEKKLIIGRSVDNQSFPETCASSGFACSFLEFVLELINVDNGSVVSGPMLLTREHIQVIHSDFNEIWPVDTPRCPGHDPKRIRVPIAPFHIFEFFLSTHRRQKCKSAKIVL